MSKPAAELVQVQEAHVLELLADIRPHDRQELQALNGGSEEHELRTAIANSERVRTCMCDGKVLAIFGDIRYDDAVGLPWMISTNQITRYVRPFLAECRGVVDDMRTRHLILMNMSYAENTLANRWLKWLGFTFHDAIPFGKNGELFYPFTMERS